LVDVDILKNCLSINIDYVLKIANKDNFNHPYCAVPQLNTYCNINRRSAVADPGLDFGKEMGGGNARYTLPLDPPLKDEQVFKKYTFMEYNTHIKNT